MTMTGPGRTGTRSDQATVQRARRRFTRRQWARRWLSLRYVVAAAVVLGLFAGGIWLVFFSNALSVQQVEVRGNKLLSATTVRRVADVPMGEPLALADLERTGNRVGALAEVKRVDVTRAWPDRVEIAVVERTPIAVVELGGRVRGLDEEGVVFRDYRRVPRGLPLVRPATSTGADALSESAAVVAAMPSDLARRVDHVEVETIDQITLVLRDGRQVLWGSAEDSGQKAEVLGVLLQEKGRVYDVSVPASPTVR